jgi:putative transcriptional regulator
VLINRVSRLLGERRENIREFSRHAGIAYATAHSLYHGTTTRIELQMLDRLCDYFGVTPSEILEYVPTEEGSQRREPDSKSSRGREVRAVGDR